MFIASVGVFGGRVPVGILLLLGFRIVWYLKRRSERERYLRSLDPEDERQVRAAVRGAGLNDLRRRVIWVVGFLATLVLSALLVNALLGPGLRSIVAAIALWLLLWGLFARVTGVGWIWTGQDFVRIVHRNRETIPDENT